MTIEFKLLVWSTALALIQMILAVSAAIAQVGLFPLVGNRENLPALEGWAGRAQRAHRNMLESLIVFAALVLVAQFAGKTNAATALGAQLFFWARLAYAPAYVIGVPWLRTALWGISFAGLLQILWQIL
ncbi:MAG TPA: MAPEG family protein [Rhizomicrobium sp.]|nr:MAPEG family protein [Rhizomicrobium sp.]